ncbi:MAG TPA: MerR family transcriptional regulator [Thermomicrobiales bacterium]|nr:MerR family transcriptional regulator [Thermomicrobiales bacterium]
MREVLRIGEVARLLGVTTKTVRHYHKVGLLAGPRRSAGGYRLYTAADLLRLHRIRQLQALGLSLRQIGDVLGAPDEPASLRAVLRALDAELAAQAAALAERRERIARLLAAGESAVPDELAGPVPAPETRAMLERLLAEHRPDVSPTLRRQEERAWARLDSFAWPDAYRDAWRRLAEHFAAHPEQLRRLHALSERLAALPDLPADAPEVAQLAAEWADYLREHPLPAELVHAGAAGDAFGMALADLLGGDLAPAQRRFIELAERYGRPDAGARPARSEGGAR